MRPTRVDLEACRDAAAERYERLSAAAAPVAERSLREQNDLAEARLDLAAAERALGQAGIPGPGCCVEVFPDGSVRRGGVWSSADVVERSGHAAQEMPRQRAGERDAVTDHNQHRGDDMTARYRPEPMWWAPASDPADPASNGETLLPGETIPEARVRLGCYDTSSSALVTGTKEMLAEQAVKSAEWRQSMGLGSGEAVRRAQEALASRRQEANAARDREYGPARSTEQAVQRAGAAVDALAQRSPDEDRAEQLRRWSDDDLRAPADDVGWARGC